MPRNLFRTVVTSLSIAAAALCCAEASAQIAYGVTATSQLVRFDVATPGTIVTSIPVSGLAVGDTVVGIDFRLADGKLFALGSSGRLYTIDTGSGTAIAVGSGVAISGTSFGFDFNPTVDRIRVVSEADQNLRLNPSTGALAATDTPLTYAAGDPNAGQNPAVAGVAYSNNVNAAATTTLYGIDTGLDVLVIHNPPNSGILNTIGPLGVNVTSVLGFDILTGTVGVESGFAALQVGAATGLYRINLATGAATLVGNFPAGTVITSLAVSLDPPRLANISTRARVETGDNVVIGGFVIGGASPKTVLVRARGPSLAAQGVPGTMSDPFLQLFSGSTQIAVNNNWGDAANASSIQALGYAPSDPRESAILVTLSPGPYTAIVTGIANTTGVGIVEVFEVDATGVPLINIATRGRVISGGSDVMIAGFIIQGNAPQTVVVRARGPSLAAQGVPGTLADPQLQLMSGVVQIASNNNWFEASNSPAIVASGYAPPDAMESAIMMSLGPGAYTAIVSGLNNTSGVAIVEVFALPN